MRTNAIHITRPPSIRSSGLLILLLWHCCSYVARGIEVSDAVPQLQTVQPQFVLPDVTTTAGEFDNYYVYDYDNSTNDGFDPLESIFTTTTTTTDAPTATPAVVPTTTTTTNAPTSSPVVVLAVSSSTTSSPTQGSTTMAPVIAIIPTVPPTPEPTVAPTQSPVTESPTSAPQVQTTRPTGTLFESSIDNVVSVWDGLVGPLDGDEQEEFERTTSDMIVEYWGLTDALTNLKVTTTITRQRRLANDDNNGDRRHLRHLQTTTDPGPWEIAYTHNIGYEGPEEEKFSLSQIVLMPFNSEEKRVAYVNRLSNSNYPAFASLEDVSDVTVVENANDNSSNNNDVGQQVKEDQPPNAIQTFFQDNMMYVIIVAAATGFLLIATLALVCFCRRRKQREEKLKNSSRDAYMTGAYGVSTANMSHSFPQDDSTLADPTPKFGVNTLNGAGGGLGRVGAGAGDRSVANFGDQSVAPFGDQSVATIDYDYSKAYGGYGDRSVVSMASATIGDGTHPGTTGNHTIHGTINHSTANGDSNTIFSDDVSFNPGQMNGGGRLKEELIDVQCPPGKLGVVIDTPTDGAPVIHAIKESSVISDKLRVGDKLVAVDDEDVRAWTAIKVSKLISRKSSNPVRTLTVIRGSTIDERD